MRFPYDPEIFDLPEFEFNPYEHLLEAKLALESMVEVYDKRLRAGKDTGDMNDKLGKLMTLYNVCTRLLGERETISNYMRVHKLQLLEAQEITNQYAKKRNKKSTT